MSTVKNRPSVPDPVRVREDKAVQEEPAASKATAYYALADKGDGVTDEVIVVPKVGDGAESLVEAEAPKFKVSPGGALIQADDAEPSEERPAKKRRGSSRSTAGQPSRRSPDDVPVKAPRSTAGQPSRRSPDDVPAKAPRQTLDVPQVSRTSSEPASFKLRPGTTGLAPARTGASTSAATADTSTATKTSGSGSTTAASAPLKAQAQSKTSSASAAALAGVPQELLPLTPENAADFELAVRTALQKGEPWAQALVAASKKEVQQIETDLTLSASAGYSSDTGPSPDQLAAAIADGKAELIAKGNVWLAVAHAAWTAQHLDADAPGLAPITNRTDKAFEQKLADALGAKEPWALDLVKSSQAELQKAHDAFIAQVTANSYEGPGPDQAETMWQDKLVQLRASGDVTANAVRAKELFDRFGATPALPDYVPDPAKDPAGFRQAYLAALELNEPWAAAVQKQSAARLAALTDEATARAKARLTTEDARTEPYEEEVNALLGPELKSYSDQNAPWALALVAESAKKLVDLQTGQVKDATVTGFVTGDPEVLGPKEKSGAKAADGSLKVPARKEKYVLGYVRTNPVVKDLRDAHLANIYNPLYLQHMSAALQASPGPDGTPPAGNGYLALTQNGFARVYDDSRTPEENKMIAELSLKTGADFASLHDAKVPQALDWFNAQDPSKKGSSKLSLDRTSSHDMLRFETDGQGHITTYQHRDDTTWTKVGIVAGQVGLGVAALVCTVCGAPVAAAWLEAANAAKGLYEGIQKGDWLGAIISAAGAYAGIAGTGVLGTAAKTGASTVTGAVEIASGLRGIVEGIKDKNLANLLMGVAGAASGVASLTPMGSFSYEPPKDGSIIGTYHFTPNEVHDVFQKIADVAQKGGLVAAFGEEGVKLLQSGDYMGALACALQIGGAVGGSLGLSPTVAKDLTIAANTLTAVEAAVKGKNYGDAVSKLLEGVQGVVDPKKSSDVLAAGIALSGVIGRIKDKDPLGAAGVAAEFVTHLLDERTAQQARLENATPEQKTSILAILSDLDAQLTKFGGITGLLGEVGPLLEAVKSNDVNGILAHADTLISELAGKGRVQDAVKLIEAVRKSVAAVKSGDFASITRAGNDLRAAFDQAFATVNDPPPEETLPVGHTLIDASILKPGDAPPGDPYGLTLPPEDCVDGVPPELKSYTVTGKDSLWSIAQAQLGDASRWPELYALNKDLIGPDPTRVRTGLVLQLPDASFSLGDGDRAAIVALGGGKAPKVTAPAKGADPKASQELLDLKKRQAAQATDLAALKKQLDAFAREGKDPERVAAAQATLAKAIALNQAAAKNASLDEGDLARMDAALSEADALLQSATIDTPEVSREKPEDEAEWEDVLGSLKNVMDSVDGLGGKLGPLEEALGTLNEALEAAHDKGTTLEGLGKLSSLSGTVMKLIGASAEAIPYLEEAAPELGKVFEKIGRFINVPGAAVKTFTDCYGAITGHTLKGTPLKAEQRLRLLLDAPYQLRDSTEILQALSPAFEAAMESVMRVANPALIAVTVTFEEFNWAMKNVYGASKSSIADFLSAQAMGGTEAQLHQKVSAQWVTDPKKAPAALAKLLTLFNQGRKLDSGNDALTEFRDVVNRSLPNEERQILWDLEKKLQASPNDQTVQDLALVYLSKLEPLAQQFITDTFRKGRGG